MSATFHKTINDKLANLPDVEKCKAKEIIGSKSYDLVDCLVEHPLCKHSLAFGYRRLCRHPSRMEIVKRTKENS